MKPRVKTTHSLLFGWTFAKAYPKRPTPADLKGIGSHYRVPSEVVELVMAHMDALQMRFTVGSVTTKWQRLEKGIMAECTISVALFIAAMNLLLKAGGMQCRGPKQTTARGAPLVELSWTMWWLMTRSIQGTQWILSALEKMATWSRLQFKASVFWRGS